MKIIRRAENLFDVFTGDYRVEGTNCIERQLCARCEIVTRVMPRSTTYADLKTKWEKGLIQDFIRVVLSYNDYLTLHQLQIGEAYEPKVGC
jgi:hypothetical protein